MDVKDEEHDRGFVYGGGEPPPPATGDELKDMKDIKEMDANRLREVDPDDFDALPDEALAGMDKERAQALPPGVFAGFDEAEFDQLPPEAIAGMSDEDIENLPPEVIDNFERRDFDALSPEAREGFDPDDMARLPPETINPAHIGDFRGDAIRAMSKDQLAIFTDEVVAEMPVKDRVEMLANLDPNNPDHAEVIEKFVPDDWEIADDGSFKRPDGAPVNLPSVDLPGTRPADLKIFRDIPDLSKGFAAGGALEADGKSALDDMNDILGEYGFQVTQGNYGILGVRLAEGSIPGVAEYSFVPEAIGLAQAPAGTPPGFELNEDGEFVLTLANGEQVPVTPSLKDPEGLLGMSENWSLELESDGRIGFWEDKTKPDYIAGVPSPEVLEADSSRTPGVYRAADDKSALIVYADGSAQRVLPALLSPQEFKALALLIQASDIKVTGVVLNADGSATVTYEEYDDDASDGTADDGTSSKSRTTRRTRTSSASVDGSLDASSSCDTSTATFVQTDADTGASVYYTSSGTYLYVTSDGQCQEFSVNPLSSE